MSQGGIVRFEDELTLTLCGEAGHGIQSVELLATALLKDSGRYVFSTKEFMSRIRGGSNSTTIRVASRPVDASLYRIDILIPFDRAALDHVRRRLSPETVIFADEDTLTGKEIPGNPVTIPMPFRKTAEELGNVLYTNMVASGFIAGLFSIDEKTLAARVRGMFTGERSSLADVNVEAARKGSESARRLVGAGGIAVEIPGDPAVHDYISINGAEAVGLGALAGGCDFVSSYPMSPSTAVLVFMAEKADQFGVIVEQAEDEISAANMVIGAWYAGARAMVTTSGGGFALMEETVGLAGMLESPLVVHLAQRPGPATGLPTRTEQGDLNLALYSGHGEFPRILLAPGTPLDAIELTQKAFSLADLYQIPVFILTDQYFIDSSWTIPAPRFGENAPRLRIVETKGDYRRYRLTDEGISPRGVPGWGEGLVVVDSDEHDEEGHITENHGVRVDMVDKRLAKYAAVRQDAQAPELYGPEDYDTLIISWGSTGPIVREALRRIRRPGTSLLHFRQVYPLHPKTPEYLAKARRRVMVEGNATAQFERLLRAETGYGARDRILKYDGLQFTVDELVQKFEELDESEVGK